MTSLMIGEAMFDLVTLHVINETAASLGRRGKPERSALCKRQQIAAKVVLGFTVAEAACRDEAEYLDEQSDKNVLTHGEWLERQKEVA